MHLDYFLYDNRTPGEVRDWGVKLATGALAKDSQARRLFVDYCSRSFNTSLGALRPFGAALGGLPRPGGGYLLCITLETRDPYGRAACGFVGIYCPGRPQLRSLLTEADPVATAQTVYETDTPPDRLTPRGRALIGPGDPHTEPQLSSFRPGSRLALFDRKSSPRDAAAILWNALERGAPLPSILGIAAWTSRHALETTPDQVTFYQQLPRDLELLHDESVTGRDEDLGRATPEGPPPRSREKRLPSAWWVAGALALIVLFGALLWLDRGPGTRGEKPADEPEPAGALDLSAETDTVERPQDEKLVPASSGRLLARVEPLIVELQRLKPEALRSSAVAKILATVDVLPDHEQHRTAMMEFLESGLPKFRTAMVERNLAFYFNPGQGTEIPESRRAELVLGKLGELRPPAEGCQQLRNAFAALMNEPEEPPAIWCRIVEGLAKEQQIGRPEHRPR